MSRTQNLNNSFHLNRSHRTNSPQTRKNINYSFSEVPNPLNETLNPKKSPKQVKLPQYKPSTSLAEENLVRNFNKFNKNLENNDIPTNEPQRIELPLFFNTPNRNVLGNRQPSVKKNNKKDQKGITTDSSVYVRSVRRLRDYNLLAFACRRAGKTRDEGRAYYSMGVLCDNISKLKDGIGYYKKFLQVCKSIGDVHGEALAYNCIGVNYQMLAQEDPKLYEDAIQYHNKHEELADVNGKFLASINLGLCYDQLQDYKYAMKYYQDALRHSIKMANLVGQTIAIGNIGKIGAKGLHQNKDKMKVFVEKYLKLSGELRDKKGEINALMKMGQLNIQGGEFDKGKDHFLKALELAEQNVEENSFSLAKCGFAVSNVENNINDYKTNYESEIGKYSPQKLVKY